MHNNIPKKLSCWVHVCSPWTISTWSQRTQACKQSMVIWRNLWKRLISRWRVDCYDVGLLSTTSDDLTTLTTATVAALLLTRSTTTHFNIGLWLACAMTCSCLSSCDRRHPQCFCHNTLRGLVVSYHSWLAVVGSIPGHDTGNFCDRWPSFAGKLSCNITTA